MLTCSDRVNANSNVTRKIAGIGTVDAIKAELLSQGFARLPGIWEIDYENSNIGGPFSS